MSRVNLGAGAVKAAQKAAKKAFEKRERAYAAERKATKSRQIAQEKASKKAFEKRRKAGRKTAEKQERAYAAERQAVRKRQIAQEKALGHKVGASDKAFLEGKPTVTVSPYRHIEYVRRKK